MSAQAKPGEAVGMEILTHEKLRRWTPWRIAAWCGGLLVFGFLLTTGPYYYWVKVHHRLLPIAEGRLYKSGEMSPEALRETVRDYGIRTVIDLRHDDPKSEVERAAMAEIGVRYFNIPSRQVPDEDGVKAFLQVMDETLANPALRPVLIHCKDGTGRSPLFSAIYRMEYEGWSNEAARSRAYWETVLGNFEPESRKGKFILGYVPRSRTQSR